MDKSTHLLNALKTGDTAQIGLAFTAAIREKVATALDVRKVAVASEFYGESVQIDEAFKFNKDKHEVTVGDTRGSDGKFTIDVHDKKNPGKKLHSTRAELEHADDGTDDRGSATPKQDSRVREAKRHLSS